MNKKNIDIDNVFARLREESKPTPLTNLVEARESGALFALKQSPSASLAPSALLWLGVGLTIVLSGGLYYGLSSASKDTTSQAASAKATAHTEQTTAGASSLHQQLKTEGTASAQQQAHSAQTAVSHAEYAGSSRTETIGGPQYKHTDKGSAVQHERSASTRLRASVEHSAQQTVRLQKQRTTARVHRHNSAAAQQIASTDTHTLRSAHNTAEQAQRTERAADKSQSTSLHSITEAVYIADEFNAASIPAAAPLTPVEDFPLYNTDGTEPYSVSLTLNSTALAADIVELQGEWQLSKHIGVSATLGLGNVASSSDSSYQLLTAGVQAHYYLLGDFSEGLQVGTQILFSSTDFRVENSFLYDNGRVLSIIPYAGYKLTMESGLTFNIQAGIGAGTPVFIPSNMMSTGRNTEYKWHVSTRLQVNIGWSL